MSNLSAIVYISSMVRELSETQIENLVCKAAQRNKEHKVTGILLCYHGSFMQYIEGPETDLAKIYDIIKSDTKHVSLIKLVHTPITEREFSDWSMAYVVTTKKQVDQLTQESWLESDDNKSPGRKLLGEFWKTSRIIHKG